MCTTIVPLADTVHTKTMHHADDIRLLIVANLNSYTFATQKNRNCLAHLVQSVTTATKLRFFPSVVKVNCRLTNHLLTYYWFDWVQSSDGAPMNTFGIAYKCFEEHQHGEKCDKHEASVIYLLSLQVWGNRRQELLPNLNCRFCKFSTILSNKL